MIYGEYIRKMRLSRNNTLRIFCMAIGIDPVVESRIERGVCEPHNKEFVERIISFLELTEDEINTMRSLSEKYEKQEEKVFFPAFPKRRKSDATRYSASNMGTYKW